MIQNKNCLNNWFLFGISIVISVVLLFVYSKNSLLYPMNDYEDINIFFAVTDALFNGKILYRDVFEHKGPLLYFFYSIVHILGNSYFTLWVWECISVALFVFFGVKTILLYDEEATRPLCARKILYAICLAFCLCASSSFISGGTPEELFLWMSSYALYVTLRCLKNDQYYIPKELIIFGLLCGAMFWVKYSLLGLYSGLALYVIIWNLAQKSMFRLCKTIVYFFIGFAITCVPIIIYCIYTHSFGDMIDVYFIGNIFGVHETPAYAGRLNCIYNLIYKNIIVFLFMFGGLLYIILKERYNIKQACVCMFATTFFASCCLPAFWYYYPMQMYAFIPFGVVAWRGMHISSFRLTFILATIFLFYFCGSITIVLLTFLGLLYTMYSKRCNLIKATICMFAMAFAASYSLPIYCFSVFGIELPIPLFIISFCSALAWRETRIRPFALACSLVSVLAFYCSGSYGFIIYGSLASLKCVFEDFVKAAIPCILLSAALNDNILSNTKIKKSLLCICSLVVCVWVFPYIRDPSYYTVQPSPQMRFARIISQVPNASIFIYKSYDFGFYKSSNTYPHVKYFCDLDLIHNRQSEQLGYIKNEIIDFIITTKQPDAISEDIRDTSYQLIDTSEPFYINGYSRVFYLYGKQK